MDTQVILESIRRINGRGDCSDFDLVGLLGLMYRHTGSSLFPSQLRQPLEECVLGFKYWHDEAGPNGLGSPDAMCYTTENHSILFHTCEILAGQLYPDRSFSQCRTKRSMASRKGRTVGESSGWRKRGMDRL